GKVEQPADDVRAVEAHMLEVDPEVVQLHEKVARIRADDDQATTIPERSASRLHQLKQGVGLQVLDQVGGEYAVKFSGMLPQIAQAVGLDRFQALGLDQLNHAGVCVDPNPPRTPLLQQLQKLAAATANIDHTATRREETHVRYVPLSQHF